MIGNHRFRQSSALVGLLLCAISGNPDNNQRRIPTLELCSFGIGGEVCDEHKPEFPVEPRVDVTTVDRTVTPTIRTRSSLVPNSERGVLRSSLRVRPVVDGQRIDSADRGPTRVQNDSGSSALCSGCFHFDIDLDGRTDALTDGLLILRYLFGFSGSTLTNGAISSDATRLDSAEIESYLLTNLNEFDIDGDNRQEALTDGLLFLRYLFGFRGSTLTEGATTDASGRTHPSEIVAFVEARLDSDVDGDGIGDAVDIFPNDAGEWYDTDSDGVGNNEDVDDDNDGIADTLDRFPRDPAEWGDFDSDGTGDNSDDDDDNDGVVDIVDPFPLNALRWDNIDPVAHAGVNQVAVLDAEVTLYGGASSDGDGDTLSYAWSFVSKPPTSNSSLIGTGQTVTFVADAVGTYTAKLAVNDGATNSKEDVVRVETVTSRSVLTEGTANGKWPSYAGNLSSDRYAPLAQMTPGNTDDVEIVWRWRSPDNDIDGPQNSRFESTPLMIDGVLYTSTSFSQVAAIDAGTGETLWVHRTEAHQYGRPPNNGFLHRGLAYAEANGRKYLYIATGDGRLIAINPVSGERISGFGSLGNGTVDLIEDVPRLNASNFILNDSHDQPFTPDLSGIVVQVGNSSPPVICRNVLIVGSQVHDGEVLPPSPPGDVRGFDPVTGELLWTFHTIPREGEFGIDTWGNDSWKENGNTNVWAPMSVDEELGHVYLPVSCPTNNYYGGRRPGDNLFANSIVSLDCTSGERNWHYQTVHHDIWDYDLPAAPNLMNITVDQQPVKAIAQVSKQGFVYVLDRRTGEPIWPIVETPVPQSVVPGEQTSLTQPIPTKPPPFVRQGSAREDLADPSSADGYDVGPLYTPPTENGLIVTPGEGGGANWGGASFDPQTQTLYVTGFGPLTYLIQMVYGGPNFYYVSPQAFYGPTTGSPYGGAGSSITAYDMNEGTINWQEPGTSYASAIGLGAVLTTKTLLFYKNSAFETLNIVNKSSGNLIRQISLGGSNLTGSPMTYLHDGRQFVVVATGAGDDLTELVALALPIVEASN